MILLRDAQRRGGKGSCKSHCSWLGEGLLSCVFQVLKNYGRSTGKVRDKYGYGCVRKMAFQVRVRK